MLLVNPEDIPTSDQIKSMTLDDLVDVYKVCQDLKELCIKENGIGISAVQAGIPWKLFLVKGNGSCPLVPKGQFGYFVDCEYEPLSDEKTLSLEGCLSLKSPDGNLRFFQVERFQKIRVFGYRLILDSYISCEELDVSLDMHEGGIIFQHEIDHQLGPEGLISAKGKEIFVW